MSYLLETRNSQMAEVIKIIKRVAPSSSTVLILGESGTGKEVLARYLHFCSQRKGPFIAVNCAAIPEELLEAELFGYEKGAFTGAIKSKPGKFEQAEGGTLFLDEIGDLPLKLQAKLLRAIQEKQIERLGGERPIKVNTRIVAATNQNLEALVKEKRFREDLYFRLNVISVEIPPLRERKEDIPLLCKFLLKKICERENIREKSISDRVMKIFMKYHWPGNIRELENLLERMVILSEGEELDVEDLPPHLKNFEEPKVEKKDNLLEERCFFTKSFLELPDLKKGEISLNDLLQEIEIYYLKKALELTGGVKSQAAQLLGLNRTTLIEKLKRYKLA
ncbi:MAG: RNA polymerase subunit sigma-54 [Caldimicrobium thiodismutans]|uniref:RNA polymerase subunit sigma-54 n=1 Tax=Caldimicrobium thiodismutans TaxID=1653476 RepID=A0A2N7PKD2_9BACT|nr:MAG: RNA polymerase subunit sigma-54 [Caldimicrobium thiodismutans]